MTLDVDYNVPLQRHWGVGDVANDRKWPTFADLLGQVIDESKEQLDGYAALLVAVLDCYITSHCRHDVEVLTLQRGAFHALLDDPALAGVAYGSDASPSIMATSRLRKGSYSNRIVLAGSRVCKSVEFKTTRQVPTGLHHMPAVKSLAHPHRLYPWRSICLQRTRQAGCCKTVLTCSAQCSLPVESRPETLSPLTLPRWLGG